MFANQTDCTESELGSSNTTMGGWTDECQTGRLVSREVGDGAHCDRGREA